MLCGLYKKFLHVIFINIHNLWICVVYELGDLKFPNSFTIADKIMQCNLIRISFRFAAATLARCVVSVQNTQSYTHG